MKKKQIFLDKKTQIASGLTWFVGFLIIFFIMFLFVSGSLILAGQRKVKQGLVIREISSQDLILTKQLVSFLETEVGKEKIKDIIKEDKLDEYKKEAEKFVDIYFPAGQDMTYRRVWLRIYNEDEKIGQYPSGIKYQTYGVWRGGSSPSNEPCNPVGVKKSVFKDIISSFSYVHIFPNKKIALCLEHNPEK
ncbi:MAG: hypothetical protein KJ559_02740 [Nanoarchaeota archaeon]|nr:hypothetical protein [Nanoarchaeota archaeon]